MYKNTETRTASAHTNKRTHGGGETAAAEEHAGWKPGRTRCPAEGSCAHAYSVQA